MAHQPVKQPRTSRLDADADPPRRLRGHPCGRPVGSGFACGRAVGRGHLARSAPRRVAEPGLLLASGAWRLSRGCPGRRPCRQAMARLPAFLPPAQGRNDPV